MTAFITKVNAVDASEGTMPPIEKEIDLFSSSNDHDNRFVTQAEIVAMDEKRSQYVEKLKLNSTSETSTTESSEEIVSGAYSWNLHNNCRHRIISVGENFSGIRLEDGSFWQVPYFDRWMISHWVMEHRLYITANPYSSYHFKIVNVDTNESVEANCLQKADYMSPFTRIIEYAAYDGIRLNDGTFWSIDSFESPFFSNWLEGDRVIVGVNTGFDGYFFPYIIYNYNTNSHVIANLY
jgi:hypothetical protein